MIYRVCEKFPQARRVADTREIRGCQHPAGADRRDPPIAPRFHRAMRHGKDVMSDKLG
jgi:hypothetical protein